ncbi:MAG TPA: hypothetical protein VGB99_13650 [Acidobacteriota bacterium]|jgi:hypothetical protein
MGGVLIGVASLLAGQALHAFGLQPLSRIPHWFVAAGALLGILLAPGRVLDASRTRSGLRAFAVVLGIYLCFQLPLGIGYALNWIHFTAGAGSFQHDQVWQWALGAVEWYVLMLLGPSLILFGLLQASLEPRALSRIAPALAALLAALVGLLARGAVVEAETLVERVLLPALAVAALSQVYGRGGSLPDVALGLGLLAFTQRFLICNVEREFLPVGYYVIGQRSFLLLELIGALLAVALALRFSKPGELARA